ncbi:unnamed protein product [Xylocopa violacea]
MGTIPLEQACNLETNTINEDWSGNYPSYDPLLESENKNVLRTKIGLSKAKKKQFKQTERDRILILEKNNGNDSNVSIIEKTIDFDQPLRAPKNVPKAVSYTENDSIDKVTSALESTSINETSNSLKKKNITILNNNSPKKVSSQTSSLRNRNINTYNVSLISENISEQDKENISAKEKIPFAMNYSIPTTVTNDSKVKDEFESNACQGSSLKMQGHSKETKIQKDSVQPNVTKEYSIKSRNDVHLNSEMVEKLYGAVRKISTGRGFTMAHQFLNSTLSQTENTEDRKNLDVLFGYDDD